MTTAPTSTRISLGTGILGWDPYERQTDRYGTVSLSGPDGRLTGLVIPQGVTRASLHAIVLISRPQMHVGDWARGISPTRPAMGYRAVLADTGTVLVTESEFGGTCIGVRPDDGRAHDWLRPEELYRVVDQQVRLELVV